MEQKRDPSHVFSMIPAWNKEFACLVGLEEVVQFRLDWLDNKIVYTAPNKRRTKGGLKKFLLPAVAVPATLPKDPCTCAKCDTDVSHSWKRDVNNSILCHSCLKISWRKDDWTTRGPEETIIKPVTDGYESDEPMKEDSFPLQAFIHSVPQVCDPQDSSSSFSEVHPDPLLSCSSPCSSDRSFSPPVFFSNTDSNWSASCSSDDDFSCVYISSSSQDSSPSSESSSCLTLSPKNWRKNDKTPFWMKTSLAKGLFKDHKADRKMKKGKEEPSTGEKSGRKEETSGKVRVASFASNQQMLSETQPVRSDSEPSASTIAENNKLTLGLKPGQVHLQKLTPDVSRDRISGSSTCTLESGKSKSTVLSSFSGKVRNQDSILRYLKNKSSPSLPSTISAPTKVSALSQTTFSTNQTKTIRQDKVKCEAAQKQIDKWIQKPKTSSTSSGQPGQAGSGVTKDDRNLDRIW